jgi:hypothetical protein
MMSRFLITGLIFFQFSGQVLFAKAPDPKIMNKPKLIPFSFTLNQSAVTSAGVYSKSGVLLRTLWSAVRFSQGLHKASWDSFDDEGNFVGFGDYFIKVLSNNIQYNWDGVIGNTSKNLTGPTVHREFSLINGITINGNYAYYIIGYGEGSASQAKFALSDPQVKIHLNTPANGSGSTTMFACNDGKRVYYGGYDAYSTNGSDWFVFATDLSNDNLSSFSAGQTFKLKYTTTYNSVIDRFTDAGLGISGMAVQKNGQYLFISHGSLNQIKVYNKTTGGLVQTLSFNTPKKLAMDNNDNLWIQSGSNDIQKFNVGQNGGLTASGIIITGVQIPLAMNVAPIGSVIAILDGGTSQQIKFFQTANGALDHILGTAGGYANSPDVNNFKFFFSYSQDDNTRFGQIAFVSYAPDGSYWVGDTYNRRIMHYSSSDVYIEQIMTLPYIRSVQVDANNSERLFSDFLEFHEDATQPVQNSWVLIKNWRYGVVGDFTQQVNYLKAPTTMKNGKTYSLLLNPISSEWDIVEFANSGVRYTGLAAPIHSLIMGNGDIRRISDRSLGNPTFVYEKKLTGFDGNNNPIYGDEQAIVMSPNISDRDPVLVGAVSWEGVNLDSTTSGNFITFEGGAPSIGHRSTEWHLGAIKNNQWVWKTAKGTDPAYSGPYPTDGSYDIGNTVKYPGGPILLKENSIFWGYHGEFWKQSQVNKWQHVYEDGLLLGIFGATGVDAAVAGIEAAPQMAGNVISAALVKINEDYFLYHCDESGHGGVHRWHISGLNTIHEDLIPVTLTSDR